MNNRRKIIISGTGCALADFLYSDIDFGSKEFGKYLSKNDGDGGLSPGRLVFADELEDYAGISYPEILQDIRGNREAVTFNLGGPSLVSLIHVAQLLEEEECEVNFFGVTGNDSIGKKILEKLRETPLRVDNYRVIDQTVSAFTDVFSDPAYDSGHGERTFVTSLGIASDYGPESLHEKFFHSDIVCFGGTALVPQIHDELSFLLKKAKRNKCITIVNTVFDFRNEKKNPGKPWPLVQCMDDYQLIDVLIMDCEESLKISGMSSILEAAEFFVKQQVGALIITNGAHELFAFSDGRLFGKMALTRFPVSTKVNEEFSRNHGLKGDTTGCGDNFAGGVIASLAMQLMKMEAGKIDLKEAVAWGVASGGFSCFYVGGTFIEKQKGEKREIVEQFKNEYTQQISCCDDFFCE